MWQIIILVMTVHLLSCISPGPDFAMVVKTALNYSRRSAILTALGIGGGILLHTTYCAFGLGIILIKTPWLFALIRLLGGIYLSYLGVKGILSHQNWQMKKGHHHAKDLSVKKAIRQGFLVNATNPKAILFIFGLFIIIAKQHSLALSLFFIVEMTVVTFLWFLVVAYLMTHEKIKAKLLATQHWVNRVLGILLLGFGLELLWGLRTFII